MGRQAGILIITTTLLVGVLYGYAQQPKHLSNGVYEHAFDSTYVWHPEQIYIVWPDIKLEFRLPYEQDRSGVANLMFRDRSSGTVYLLDSAIANRSFGNEIFTRRADDGSKIYRIDSVTHYRRAKHFDSGAYDAILLYNNGKYITYNNLTFNEGVKMVVDMAQQPIRSVDADSREWLKLRKFTDIVGGARVVEKTSPAGSLYKIAGYVFNNEKRVDDAIFRFSHDGRYAAATSRDGYFEIEVPGHNDNVIYSFDLSYSPPIGHGIVSLHGGHAKLDVKANTWLFIITEKKESDYKKDTTVRYRREFPADTTYLWHPEQFHIVWPDMKIDFRFPSEKERSGIANLLFWKNRSIRLLDYVTEHISNNRTYFDRHYTRFEPGNYDVILLYNNGKYIVYENLTLEQGLNIVVDMAGQPVRPADAESREWLNLRKFTDNVGYRRIYSYYEMNNSQEKMLGYIFNSGYKQLARSGCSLGISTDYSNRQTFSALDGYFELDYDEKDIGSMLKISPKNQEGVEIEIKANSGYFIVLERIPQDTKIIDMNFCDY